MKKCKSTSLYWLRLSWKFQASALRDRFFDASRDPYDSVLINRSKLRPLFLNAPRGKALWRLMAVQERKHGGINVKMGNF